MDITEIYADTILNLEANNTDDSIMDVEREWVTRWSNSPDTVMHKQNQYEFLKWLSEQ